MVISWADAGADKATAAPSARPNRPRCFIRFSSQREPALFRAWTRAALFTDFRSKSPAFLRACRGKRLARNKRKVARSGQAPKGLRALAARPPAQRPVGFIEPVVLPDHLLGTGIAPGERRGCDQASGFEQVGE